MSIVLGGEESEEEEGRPTHDKARTAKTDTGGIDVVHTN